MEQRKVLDLVKKFESNQGNFNEKEIVNDNISPKNQIDAIGKDKLLKIKAELKKGLSFLDDETKVKVNPSVNKRWFGQPSPMDKRCPDNNKTNFINSVKRNSFARAQNIDESSWRNDFCKCKVDENEYLSSIASLYSLWGGNEEDSAVHVNGVFSSATDLQFTDNTTKCDESNNHDQDDKDLLLQDDIERNFESANSSLHEITSQNSVQLQFPKNNKIHCKANHQNNIELQNDHKKDFETSKEISGYSDSNQLKLNLKPMNEEGKYKVKSNGLEAITETVLFKGVESGDSSKLKNDYVTVIAKVDSSVKSRQLLPNRFRIPNNIEELFNEIWTCNDEEIEDVNAKFLKLFKYSFKTDLEINSDINIYNTMTDLTL